MKYVMTVVWFDYVDPSHHLGLWPGIKKIESFDRIVCRLFADDGNETRHDWFDSTDRRVPFHHLGLWPGV